MQHQSLASYVCLSCPKGLCSPPMLCCCPAVPCAVLCGAVLASTVCMWWILTSALQVWSPPQMCCSCCARHAAKSDQPGWCLRGMCSCSSSSVSSSCSRLHWQVFRKQQKVCVCRSQPSLQLCSGFGVCCPELLPFLCGDLWPEVVCDALLGLHRGWCVPVCVLMSMVVCTSMCVVAQGVPVLGCAG
jgi:hypothetical protein